ncbi:MAG: ROK family transcriptional regulator [Lachnospiraceae bacterium]|nr:ROK family transcriptional regulator [Lachnospiraceae bacterium]
MPDSITPGQIRQNNQNLIYRYLYANKAVSQQDICSSLHLSRPTVTGNLADLEKKGMICKSGQVSTEYAGRKASAYSIVPDYRISVGVEILNNELKIIAVDLYGNMIDRRVYLMQYANEDAYFKNASANILSFIDSLGVSQERILGIGFALQGLISPDQNRVIYGKILNCTGLSAVAFSRYLPFPCSFIHDSESAAVSELWVSPNLNDAFYLSVGWHLGAAVIRDGKILSGRHGHNATIEHIQMRPTGAICYCGKQGCMETLCSLTALLNDGETPDFFFEKLRSGSAEHTHRWEIFLTDLAASINMLHLVHDTDFILGGYLASYLREEDLTALYRRIRQLTPFPEADDFLSISKMPQHSITIGAALPYIRDFLTLKEI